MGQIVQSGSESSSVFPQGSSPTLRALFILFIYWICFCFIIDFKNVFGFSNYTKNVGVWDYFQGPQHNQHNWKCSIKVTWSWKPLNMLMNVFVPSSFAFNQLINYESKSAPNMHSVWPQWKLYTFICKCLLLYKGNCTCKHTITGPLCAHLSPWLQDMASTHWWVGLRGYLTSPSDQFYQSASDGDSN